MSPVRAPPTREPRAPTWRVVDVRPVLADGPVTILGWYHPTGPTPGVSEAIELNATKAMVRPAEECQRVGPQDLVQPQDQLCMLPGPLLNDACSVSTGDTPCLGDFHSRQQRGS